MSYKLIEKQMRYVHMEYDLYMNFYGARAYNNIPEEYWADGGKSAITFKLVNNDRRFADAAGSVCILKNINDKIIGIKIKATGALNFIHYINFNKIVYEYFIYKNKERFKNRVSSLCAMSSLPQVTINTIEQSYPELNNFLLNRYTDYHRINLIGMLLDNLINHMIYNKRHIQLEEYIKIKTINKKIDKMTMNIFGGI